MNLIGLKMCVRNNFYISIILKDANCSYKIVEFVKS